MRQSPDWAGLCATILAMGLSVGWAGAILIAAVRGIPLSEATVNLLLALGGAMTGAVATYLGSMVRNIQKSIGAEGGYIYSPGREQRTEGRVEPPHEFRHE